MANGSSPQRLSLATLDPRTLFPTPENISRVTQLQQQVQLQLDEDRARSKQAPDDTQARNKRSESLQYLALLNDWISQARTVTQQQQQQSRPRLSGGGRPPLSASHGVVMEPAEEGDFRVQASPQHPAAIHRCLWDKARNLHYVQVKKLRDTIYGSVRLYQIGRLSEDGIIRFSQPAEQVAIKMYDKESVRKRKSRDGHSVQEDPLRELAIQQRLSNPGHRFVMPLLATLETPNRFFAVYPFVSGGELFEFVSTNAPLPEPTARALMRGMLDGVHYCHQAGICHRDISLENFLLGGDNNNEPLLIDFGLSVIMEPDGVSGWRPIAHTGAVGKQFYMAPEVYSNTGQAYDGIKVDVWSLGVCLAIMLTGVPLWECPSSVDDRFRASIIRRELPRVLSIWGFHISPAALSLLQRMLELDPNLRPSITEVAQHEWLR